MIIDLVCWGLCSIRISVPPHCYHGCCGQRGGANTANAPLEEHARQISHNQSTLNMLIATQFNQWDLEAGSPGKVQQSVGPPMCASSELTFLCVRHWWDCAGPTLVGSPRWILVCTARVGRRAYARYASSAHGVTPFFMQAPIAQASHFPHLSCSACPKTAYIYRYGIYCSTLDYFTLVHWSMFAGVTTLPRVGCRRDALAPTSNLNWLRCYCCIAANALPLPPLCCSGHGYCCPHLPLLLLVLVAAHVLLVGAAKTSPCGVAVNADGAAPLLLLLRSCYCCAVGSSTNCWLALSK